MSSNKYLNILIYIFLLVFVYIFSFLARAYYDSLYPQINFVHVDNDCSVVILVGNIRRHINFGRNVINSDCYDLASPAISRDGKFAMFETRLILEGEKVLNAVYVYEYANDMWFKVYDYGSDKVETLAFDKGNNLQIKLVSGTKTIPYDEYSVDIVEEGDRVVDLVKNRPDVKSWLGNNENRYAWISNVDDSTVQIRVYEYFEKDNSTKTFGWYEYNRITGDLKKTNKVE